MRLRRCRFFDCRFERVDASAADWTDCTLRGVTFHDSKLLGTNWTILQSLSATRWERSNLDVRASRRWSQARRVARVQRA